MQAALFRRLREHYQKRDRLRLVLDYRKKYLDLLLRGGEEEAKQAEADYERARTQTQADIADATGGTGNLPVPPGHWPGGMGAGIEMEQAVRKVRAAIPFRAASRRAEQARLPVLPRPLREIAEEPARVHSPSRLGDVQPPYYDEQL